MTDSGYTAVFLLIDRSGSMRAIKTATQDAINEFCAAQAHAPGRVTVRIASFDAPGSGTWGPEPWYLPHCPSVAAAAVPPFELRPRGMTALYDAMIHGIDEFGAELAGLAEHDRPGTVLFAVMTDGLENSSEAKADQVRAKVEHQRDTYGWQFAYLGANQDAILEGAKMGVPMASSITYDATAGSTHAVFESLGAATVVAASSGGPVQFTEAQRRAARGKG